MLGEIIYTGDSTPTKAATRRRDATRDAKQKLLHEQMSCSASAGFVYDKTVRPGEALYHLLVPPPDEDSGEGKRMHGNANIGETSLPFQRLRIWMPDTIVTEPDGRLVWYYSNADGYICSTSSFSPEHILSKLGSVCRHSNEVIVVAKAASWESIPSDQLHAQGLAGHGDYRPYFENDSDDGSEVSGWSPFIGFKGNNSRLLTVRELGEHCGKLEEESAGGLAEWGAVGRVRCIQRFIKPKGKHAFMARTRLTSDDPVATGVRRIPATYVVTNTTQMVGTEKRTLFVQFTGPKTGEATNQEFEQRATLVDTNAGAGTVLLAQEVWRYLEYRLRHGLDELVVDFVKDDLGSWWLTQVKGFKFRRVSIERPLKVSYAAKSRRGALEVDDADGEQAGKLGERPQGFGRQRQHQLLGSTAEAQAGSSGEENASDAVLLRSIAHSRRCSLCRALYSEKDLRYRLTRRAAREFVVHLRGRLFNNEARSNSSSDANIAYRSKNRLFDSAQYRWPRCLSLFWEETVVEDKRAARRKTRVSAPGATVGAGKVEREASSSEKRELQLCDYCFQLFEKEQRLIKVEKQLLEAVGILPEPKPRGRPEIGREKHKTRFQIEMEMRFGSIIAAAIARKALNNCIPIYHGSVEARGDPLTMCRIMVAVHEIIDVPLSFLSSYEELRSRQGSEAGSIPLLYMSFELLGSKYRFEVPLPEPKNGRSPSENDEQPASTDIAVHSLKILHFISPGTKVRERPFEAYERVGSAAPCGLTRFLKEKSHVYLDFGLISQRVPVEPAQSTEFEFDDDSEDVINDRYGYDGRLIRQPRKADTSREPFCDVPMGRACISIGQFQSSYINYAEAVVPVVWENHEAHRRLGKDKAECMPHVRVSIGIQRILEDVPVWSLPEPLLKYCGLYVGPSDGALLSSAPMPVEWVALEPTRRQQADHSSEEQGATAAAVAPLTAEMAAEFDPAAAAAAAAALAIAEADIMAGELEAAPASVALTGGEADTPEGFESAPTGKSPAAPAVLGIGDATEPEAAEVGQRVLRAFESFGEYWGTIVGVENDRFLVDYDDGDADEYSISETREIVENARLRAHEDPQFTAPDADVGTESPAE